MTYKIRNTCRAQVMQISEVQYNKLLRHLNIIEYLYDELECDGEKVLIINDNKLWFFIKSLILSNEF
jgi:hypothetical protein